MVWNQNIHSPFNERWQNNSYWLLLLVFSSSNFYYACDTLFLLFFCCPNSVVSKRHNIHSFSSNPWLFVARFTLSSKISGALIFSTIFFVVLFRLLLIMAWLHLIIIVICATLGFTKDITWQRPGCHKVGKFCLHVVLCVGYLRKKKKNKKKHNSYPSDFYHFKQATREK